MDWIKNLQDQLHDKEVYEIQNIFYDSAKELMNNFTLKIDSLEIELTEIEFYYFECQDHQDLYVHLDELQKEMGYLYVHKKGNGRGGIDLTFGNNEFFGGILLRGIKDGGTFVAGPSKVREYISKKLGIEDKDHKVLQEFFGKPGKPNKICLQKRDKSKNEHNVLHSVRIGLKEEVDETFCKALYRFVRLDYLEEKKDDIKFNTYTNLKDRTKLKAISCLTKVCDEFSNEKAMTAQIKKDEILCSLINKFNEQSRHKAVICK